MFDIVRRRNYDSRRVLIDSARVLDPQFDDSLVYLTGAQQELLRNLTQYLHRQGTFVDTYYAQHYLTPDADDWDMIQSIIADLEETLMGNPNTIWGYKDGYTERSEAEYTSIGVKAFQSDPVPEGYVYVITSMAAYFTSGVASYLRLVHGASPYYPRLAQDASPTVDVPLQLFGAFPLTAGDTIYAYFNVTTQPCNCRLDLSGYKMVVP